MFCLFQCFPNICCIAPPGTTNSDNASCFLSAPPPNCPFSSHRLLERCKRSQEGAGANFGNHWFISIVSA